MTPYRFPDDGEIRFRRERDFGDVINTSVRFCRDTWRSWLPALLLIAGPLYVLSGALGVVGEGVSAVVGLAAGFLLMAGSFGYVRLYREGAADADTAEVWAETTSLIGPVLGFWAVLVVLVAVVLVPAAALVGLAAAAGQAVAIGVGVLVGLAALVALVVFTPHPYVGLAARALDEDAASDALRRAHALVRPEWGFAFATVFVASFISAAGGALVSGVATGIAVGVSGSVETTTVVGGTLAGVATLAAIPFSVFSTVASAFLYDALVARVEGTEVEEGIADIEALARETGLGGAAAPEAPRPEAPPRPESEPVDEREEGGAGGFRGGGFRGSA